MDADETPWPADTATDSIPFAALHKALAAAMAENELAGVQQLLDSLATPAERRGAFRWLAHHDGDAGLAMALTILWMTPADDPRHADYISALHGIRHPALAAWLVQALATTTDEQTRERLAAVWPRCVGRLLSGHRTAVGAITSDATCTGWRFAPAHRLRYLLR